MLHRPLTAQYVCLHLSRPSSLHSLLPVLHLHPPRSPLLLLLSLPRHRRPQRQDKDTDDRSPAEMAEFAYMLSCIADLYLTTKVLILLDNSYVGRFWTMMEAWCAMQMVTSQGVRACESEAEKRYTITCIWNADEEFDVPKLIKKLSTKTPQEMYEILSSPDVVLTNSKDKELMLPVVSSTDKHVMELFERSATMAKLDEAKMKVAKAAAAFVATAATAVDAVDEAKAAGVAEEELQAVLADAFAKAPAIQTLVAVAAAARSPDAGVAEGSAVGSAVAAARTLKSN